MLLSLLLTTRWRLRLILTECAEVVELSSFRFLDLIEVRGSHISKGACLMDIASLKLVISAFRHVADIIVEDMRTRLIPLLLLSKARERSIELLLLPVFISTHNIAVSEWSTASFDNIFLVFCNWYLTIDHRLVNFVVEGACVQ